ncbi:MAG: hypothetical protein HY752_03930 [Nitrospirae bacterium]|nr:hypothetical protein [Nitrospirota bacterium]
MKQKINIAIFLLLIFIISPSISIAGSVDYFYDDSGRLVTVTDTTNNTRLLYQYDEVGNLLSIYKETSDPQALPPAIYSIDPDIFLIGETYNVVITGENFLTTSSVTSDNPNITIKFIAAIDTKISAILSIADTASPGQANITVTTSYGSASIPINLYGVNIAPNEISLFPGSNVSLSVSLTPSAPEDVEVKINNNNPDIIETPPSATIPAGGNVAFTVTAVKGGAGTINIGNAEAIVYVIGGDEDSRGALIEAKPVSVSIGNVPSGTVISSMPVSVNIGYVPEGTVISSNPVSVNIGYIPEGSIISSSPVSVQWLEIANGIIVSQQVSIDICSDYPVRVVGTSTNYYSTLQAAYDAALDGETIQAQALTAFTENLVFGGTKSVTVEGGYNCDYTSNTGKTELKGTMRISGGTVKIKNFILKK